MYDEIQLRLWFFSSTLYSLLKLISDGKHYRCRTRNWILACHFSKYLQFHFFDIFFQSRWVGIFNLAPIFVRTCIEPLFAGHSQRMDRYRVIRRSIGAPYPSLQNQSPMRNAHFVSVELTFFSSAKVGEKDFLHQLDGKYLQRARRPRNTFRRLRVVEFEAGTSSVFFRCLWRSPVICWMKRPHRQHTAGMNLVTRLA